MLNTVWFHIGKKFQNVKQSLGEAFEKSLDSAKWEIWHGHLEQALNKFWSPQPPFNKGGYINMG